MSTDSITWSIECVEGIEGRKVRTRVSSRFPGLQCHTDRFNKAKNLYEILNIPHTASKQEIDEAFELAKQPLDPNNQRPADVDKATYLTLKLYGAHAVLSDDLQRQRYDDSLRSVENSTVQPVMKNPQDAFDNYKDIELVHRIISTTKDYTFQHYELMRVYLKLIVSEHEWRKGRDNRIYGASTRYLVQANGDNYDTYFANVRARAQRLALSGSLDLAAIAAEIQDFRTTLTSCYHNRHFGTDNTTKTMLKLMWAETERISSWINAQRYAAEWHTNQVELYLELHIMEARALHVWPIYQATGASTPIAAFVPNYLPHLSEAEVIQRIRTTRCIRSDYDRGMRPCCGEDVCICNSPTP